MFVLADEATRRVWPITFRAGGDVPPLCGPQNEERAAMHSRTGPRALRSMRLTW